MKYVLILATICFLIFMPHRNVRVEMQDENKGSDIPSFINGEDKNMPDKALDDEKRISTPSSTVERLILDIFGEDADIALAVARAESGLRCDAVGDRHLSPSSYGVFQIRAFANRPGIEELTDCEANIRYAKFMFDRQGWHPWSAYTSGAYKSFINLL